VGAVAALAGERADGRMLGALPVVLGVAAGGPGLAGADPQLERSAALDWRPRRAAHVAGVVAVVFAAVAATALIGHRLGPLAELARNAVGAGGLLALAAAGLGAGRAWIPPLAWATAAPPVLDRFWPTRSPPLGAQVVTWPAQPAGSAAALLAAVACGVAGTAAYAVWGARWHDPGS
jgi:hypothetical protein